MIDRVVLTIDADQERCTTTGGCGGTNVATGMVVTGVLLTIWSIEKTPVGGATGGTTTLVERSDNIVSIDIFSIYSHRVKKTIFYILV